MSDMLELLKTDAKLKFVLKEFPVLGEGSVQAAQVAAAVRMQDKSGGKKYLEFHQKLLGGRGQADKARALAVAKEVGFDIARIEKDMTSDEVKSQLEESFKLAEALGLNGTPSYVVGSDVLVGAVGLNTLKEKVEYRPLRQGGVLTGPNKQTGPGCCAGESFPFLRDILIRRYTLVTAGPFHGKYRLRAQRTQSQSARKA